MFHYTFHLHLVFSHYATIAEFATDWTTITDTLNEIIFKPSFKLLNQLEIFKPPRICRRQCLKPNKVATKRNKGETWQVR